VCALAILAARGGTEFAGLALAIALVTAGALGVEDLTRSMAYALPAVFRRSARPGKERNSGHSGADYSELPRSSAPATYLVRAVRRRHLDSAASRATDPPLRLPPARLSNLRPRRSAGATAHTTLNASTPATIHPCRSSAAFALPNNSVIAGRSAMAHSTSA